MLKGFPDERPFYRDNSFFKIQKLELTWNSFLFGVAKDTIDEANVFSNKSTFYKTSLVVIDEIRKRRFQAISN